MTGGLEAALFDLDGLLVDSEPLWHEAEISVLGVLRRAAHGGDVPRDQGTVRL